MITLFESPFALRLAWTLIHFLWEGTLLALLAWMAFFLLRQGRPQHRYWVGCGFLLTCVASVLVTFMMLAPRPPTPIDTLFLLSVQTVPLPSAPVLYFEQKTAVFRALPWRMYLLPYLPKLLATWMLGVFVLSLRAAGGWLWLRRLQADATPILEPTWMARLVRQAGIQRTVRLLESARIATPMCQGLFRPVILLPLGFFLHLDPLAAEAVIAHELAHLRRLDGLITGLQCVIEVLLFFHPAVWWISHRIRTEREHCCDDAAVQACGDALFYAETLSRLDDLRNSPPAMALSARGGNLMERLRRLILATPPKLHLTTPGLASIVAFSCLSALPIQARKPLPPLPASTQVPFEGVPNVRDLRVTDTPFGSGFWEGKNGLKVPEVPRTATPPHSLPPIPEGSLTPALFPNTQPPPPLYSTQTSPPSPLPPHPKPVALTFNRNGWELVEVPDNVRMVEEPEGLPVDLSTPGAPVLNSGAATSNAFKWGLRSFRFVLQPHETLRAKMKPIDAKKIQMLLDLPPGKDPCLSGSPAQSEFRQLNPNLDPGECRRLNPKRPCLDPNQAEFSAA